MAGNSISQQEDFLIIEIDSINFLDLFYLISFIFAFLKP